MSLQMYSLTFVMSAVNNSIIWILIMKIAYNAHRMPYVQDFIKEFNQKAPIITKKLPQIR